jgi:LuxR family transcriptional regulator, positive regulator of biofilm formation
METLRTTDHSIQVRLVGSNAMQNELLATFLASETGYICNHIPRLDLPIMDNAEDDYTVFYLLDAKGSDLYEIWSNLNDRLIPRYAQRIFCIYNLDPEEDIGVEAVNNGIRGIFFNTEPIDVIPKGIKAILEGELWYPRKILAKCITASRKHKHVPKSGRVNLTKREKEILLRIFSGESNQEISDKLCISYHTVKTHVYNIYRKIDTPDRFQATLWAAKHL